MTFETAVNILETQRYGIPFEAIRFLHSLPPSKELQDRILFAFEHAYDETHILKEDDFYLSTPLWYAIVAENHLCEELIDPLIHLLTDSEADNWDFLNEQASCDLTLLAKIFPDSVFSKIIEAVDREIGRNSNGPYMYLFEVFDCLRPGEEEPYKEWFLRTLEDERLEGLDLFVHYPARLQIKEAVPVLERLLVRYRGEHTEIEIEEALKELKAGHILYPEFSRPYIERRGDWEKHYRAHEECFLPDDDEGGKIESFPFNPHIKQEKIGRNDPCPCGSGKKYKKCHGR